jgi:hypothetical protein
MSPYVLLLETQDKMDNRKNSRLFSEIMGIEEMTKGFLLGAPFYSPKTPVLFLFFQTFFGKYPLILWVSILGISLSVTMDVFVPVLGT